MPSSEVRQDALRESEERYRTLVSHLPNTCVLMFDRDLRYVVAHGEQLLNTLGTSLAQVEGRLVADVAAPENLDRQQRAYRATLDGESTQVEVVRNGRSLSLHTVPIRGDDGRITGGMVFAYDITTLKDTESALRKQSAAVALLEDIATASNKSSTSLEAYGYALARVGSEMGWPVGHVYIREGDELVSSEIWHLSEGDEARPFREATRAMRFAVGEGLPGLVCASARAMWLHDADCSPTFMRARAAAEAGLRSGLAFPVMLGDEVVAVLEFYGSRLETPDEATLRLMTNVGRQLGRVVERERHAMALHSLSLHDELTGLKNRRGFLEFGRHHHALSSRNRRSFTVLFADLDGLKTINDTQGHEEGDAALRLAARALRSTFRDSDIVARLGGDEFVVLIVDAEVGSEERIEERLRAGLAKLNQNGTDRYPISMSVGTATFDPSNPVSLDILLSKADEAMYVRKRSLRDACAVAASSSQAAMAATGALFFRVTSLDASQPRRSNVPARGLRPVRVLRDR